MTNRLLLADSSVWVEALTGHRSAQSDYLRAEVKADRVLMADLVLMELLRGIRDDLRHARVRRRLLALRQRAICRRGIVLQSAQFYRDLQRRGFTVRSAVDCIIATWCIDTGTPLLHSDRDFDPFERFLGLQVVRP